MNEDLIQKAKKKAKELVYIFSSNCRECDNQNIHALHAVDELILYSRYWDDSEYWEEVKKQIQLL
jgi:hypothetical protein